VAEVTAAPWSSSIIQFAFSGNSRYFAHQRRNPDDLDVQRMIRSGSETEALGSLDEQLHKARNHGR
jgi:hypothetical protein